MKKLAIVSLVLLLTICTACSNNTSPSGSAEPPQSASPDSAANSASLRNSLIGEWVHTNKYGERLVWVFNADGTCLDYAPDYEDPNYGSHVDCYWSIGPDCELVLEFIDDEGEEAEEEYLWNEDKGWMAWYLTQDTLWYAHDEYTRK